jgi:predicted double-glycine peptidase
MQPWLETIGVLILSLSALALGLLFGKIKKRFWLLGYAIPFVLIVMVALVRNTNQLQFYQPFSFMSAGRREFVIFSFAIPMLFGTLIPRLKRKLDKILVGILVVIASIMFFVYPFMTPALVRGKLENLKTTFSDEGFCLQTTKYTCGPASAVNALAQFGIKAQEGELAILSHSSPQMGTPEDLLARAIEKRYGSEGIRCSYRYFKSIEQLKQNCPTIAVIKYSFFEDHYVTVLKVTDDKVVIADPIIGGLEYTYEEFKKQWRFVGIVLAKNNHNNL